MTEDWSCHIKSLETFSGTNTEPSFKSYDKKIITMARQGKANLFIEHNSYTRQFKVLYSYIKSEEGK